MEDRGRVELLVRREQVIKLPTDYWAFEQYLNRSTVDQREHLALVRGVVADGDPVLVRVHS